MELKIFTEARCRNFREGRKELVGRFLSADARQRQKRFDVRLGVFILREGPRFPLIDRLCFDGQPRSKANETVFVGQVWPCEVNCARLGVVVIRFELVTNFALIGALRVVGVNWIGWFWASVGDAEEISLRVTPAAREVQSPVISDDHIGQIQRHLVGHAVQRFGRDEVFEAGLVGAAVRTQMNGKQPAVRPVHRVKCFLIFRGKLRAVSKHQTGRAAKSDILNRRESVLVISRQLPAAAAVTKIAAVYGMIESCWAVPGQSPVPFHIAVEADDFSVGVESKVIGIALAGGKSHRVLSIKIHPMNGAAGRQFARHETAFTSRNSAVVGKVAHGRIGRRVNRLRDLIADDDVEMLLIGGKNDGMSTMIA